MRAKTIVPAMTPKTVRAMQMPSVGAYRNVCLEQDRVIVHVKKSENDSFR